MIIINLHNLITHIWNHSMRTIFSTLLLFYTQQSGLGQVEIDYKQDPSARIATLGFAANIGSFPFYSCTFTVTKAEASSVSSALAGERKSAVTAEHRLAVLGDTEVCECKFAPPPPIKREKSAVLPKETLRHKSTPFVGNAILKNRKQGLIYSPVLTTANLHADRKPPPEFSITPWNLGMLGHGTNWCGPEVLIERDTHQLVEFATDSNVGKLSFRFKFKEPIVHETRFFRLDPERGYLPTMSGVQNDRIKSENGEYMCTGHLLEARECSNGRWFPIHWIRTINFGNNTPIDVLELKVLILQSESKPTQEQMSITMPAGTSVNSALYTDPVLVYRLKQQEVVGIDDINTMFEMLKKSATKPRMDTAIVPQSRWPAWLIALCVLGGAAFLWLSYRLRGLVFNRFRR